MKDSELLQQVLNVASPWQVTRVVADAGSQVLDVWIAAKPQRTGWFTRARADSTAPESVWRHTNIGAWRCMVHVNASADQRPQLVPWCGDAEMPFTRGLSRQIAALLVDGVKIPSICNLLDVPLNELWKFKFNLDAGRTGLGLATPVAARAEAAVPAPATTAAATEPTATATATGASTAVPEMTHPVWERLLEGSFDIEIRVLGLKLLLTKLRDQMRSIDDIEVRMLKIHEIHRYFSRHAKTLGHELAQLARV